jgi:hypothetical protein
MFTLEELETVANGKYSKWIKVPRYKESPGVKVTEDDYFDLLEHHELESGFLIRMCQSLAKELIKYKQLDGHTC